MKTIMQHDDLISVFEFFTRQQLCRLLLVNRSTSKFINDNFANKPLIYTNLSLLKGDPNPDPLLFDDDDAPVVKKKRQFCLHLTALNCCCEQQKIPADEGVNFWNLYKNSIECNCREVPFSGESSPWSSSYYGIKFTVDKWTAERYEDSHHRECTNWQEVKEPLIEINQYRRNSPRLDNLIIEYRNHNDIDYYPKASAMDRQKKTDCCTIWKHKIHDEMSRKRIFDDFKYEHRKQHYPGWRECDALELRTGDIEHVLRHLELAYVKIYRLDFLSNESVFYDNEATSYTDEECRKFFDVLLWLVDNDRIAPGAFVRVEIRFMLILFDRLNAGTKQRGRLLDTMGKCMHLKISELELTRHYYSYLCDKSVPHLKSQMMNAFVGTTFLQNAMLTEFWCECGIDQVQLIIKAYNPQNDWHRLLVFCMPKDTRKVIDNILEDFHNTDSITFFILIPAILEANKNIASVQWNHKTNEILRVIPANSYKLDELDDDWYCRWLCTPREDGKPRLLTLRTNGDCSIITFFNLIKKNFLDSSRPVSFLIYLHNFPDAPTVQSLCLDNTKTKERLMIKKTDKQYQYATIQYVTIARHPMQANEQWVVEISTDLDPEYESRIIIVEI